MRQRSELLERRVQIVLAALLLVALLPVLAAIAVAVYRLGTPALLRQPRRGRRGHPVTLDKFRTMAARRDAIGRWVQTGLAALLMIVLLPVMAVLAAAVYYRLGTPVLFRQQRPGLHGRPFTLYKFRTMTDARDASGNLLPDGDRMTRFGNFLRENSLDELPELFNILRGEMSFVGPRPLLMEYLDRYTPEQRRRHDVRPGITGWAQVHGRNALTWEEKFKLDVWYVDHRSWWLDLRIILLTVRKVFAREGINQPGYATAEMFMGSCVPQPSEARR